MTHAFPGPHIATDLCEACTDREKAPHQSVKIMAFKIRSGDIPNSTTPSLGTPPDHPYRRCLSLSKAKLRVTAQSRPGRGLAAQSGLDRGPTVPDRGPTVQAGPDRGPTVQSGPDRPVVQPRHPYYSSTPVFLSMQFFKDCNCIYSRTRRCQLGTVDGARLSRAPIGARWRNRGRSGPNNAIEAIGPRPRPGRKPFSCNFCWSLSSGLPHSFCRTWWKPCDLIAAALWNSWNPKPTKQQCQAFTLLHRESRSGVI